MIGKTLENLGIKVKESRTHGLAGPSILPESDVHSLDLLFDIGKINFKDFATNPYIIELVNERVKNARRGLRKCDDSLAIIAAEESLWQLVFVNYLGSNGFLHNHIVEQWDVLKEIFPNAVRNETSTLKNFKSIFVNDPLHKEWTYLLDRETVSEPICSFLFPFEYANKGRIFVSSLGIGYAFMDAKIWNRAAREFEVAIERWPKEDKRLYPKTVSVLGGCYENLGEVDKAIEVLEKLVQEGAVIALTHYNLGWAYDEKARKTENKELFYRAAEQQEKAIELDPEYYDAYYNLACAYAMAGNREKAFSVVKNAKTKGIDLLKDLTHDSDFREVIE